MLVLTGIKEEALLSIEKRGRAVLELISFVNVRAVVSLTKGDRVFVTRDFFEELGPGSEGIVAEVEGADVSPVRVSLDHVDEREIQRARVKLRFVSYGRVKDVHRIEELPRVELILLEGHIVL